MWPHMRFVTASSSGAVASRPRRLWMSRRVNLNLGSFPIFSLWNIEGFNEKPCCFLRKFLGLWISEHFLVGGWPTLWKIWLRQLGSWVSQFPRYGKSESSCSRPSSFPSILGLLVRLWRIVSSPRGDRRELITQNRPQNFHMFLWFKFKGNLVGGWLIILKNMSSSMGRLTSPYMKWTQKNIWNHQPATNRFMFCSRGNLADWWPIPHF